MTRHCRVCGDDGLVDEGRSASNFARFRRLLGPKWRAAIAGQRDLICWRCQVWAARAARLVA